MCALGRGGGGGVGNFFPLQHFPGTALSNHTGLFTSMLSQLNSNHQLKCSKHSWQYSQYNCVPFFDSSTMVILQTRSGKGVSSATEGSPGSQKFENSEAVWNEQGTANLNRRWNLLDQFLPHKQCWACLHWYSSLTFPVSLLPVPMGVAAWSAAPYQFPRHRHYTCMLIWMGDTHFPLVWDFNTCFSACWRKNTGPRVSFHMFN